MIAVITDVRKFRRLKSFLMDFLSLIKIQNGPRSYYGTKNVSLFTKFVIPFIKEFTISIFANIQ